MAISKFKRFGIPAALVVGGVTAGSLFAPLGLASAQDDDGDDTEAPDAETETPDAAPDGADADDSNAKDWRRGHRARHLVGADAVTDALGLSAGELRDGLASGKTLAELAEDQGLSRDEFVAAIVDSITEAVDKGVEEGAIDADRAAEMLADLPDRVDEMIDKGPGELHRHGPRHHRGGPGLQGASEEVQGLLGLSAEEMRSALAEGQSLADLAQQQGVSIDALTDVLIAGAEERIDAAVADGKIDADRAEEMRDRLEEMIDDAINREFDGEARGGPGRHGHGRFGRGMGRPGDPDDAGPDAGDTTESSVEQSSL